jgi:ADP-ribose pyrophosphatase YjhB (NUDIX family)
VHPVRSLVTAALTGFHRLRRIIWRLRGARGRGVLAVPLTPEGRLVLLRLTYAPGWRLPGGGVERGEDPRAAALRELREEIGMRSWGEVAAIDEFDHGPADRGISTLFLVRDVLYAPRRTYEVEEVGAFHPEALPEGATPLTRAKVALALPLIRPA